MKKIHLKKKMEMFVKISAVLTTMLLVSAVFAGVVYATAITNEHKYIDVELRSWKIEPATLKPGEKFSVNYYISSKDAVETTSVLLVCRLVNPSGEIIVDSSNDKLISLPEGGHGGWYFRLFDLPEESLFGVQANTRAKKPSSRKNSSTGFLILSF